MENLNVKNENNMKTDREMTAEIVTVSHVFADSLIDLCRKHQAQLATIVPDTEHEDPSRIAVRAAHISAILYGVDPDDLLGPSRCVPLPEARGLAMMLARDVTGWTYTRIGEAFSRDHSSVIHSIKQLRNLRDTEPDVAEKIERAKIMFGGSNDG